MIQSFKDKNSEKIFDGKRPRNFPDNLLRRTYRKLVMLDNAKAECDLMVFPGNQYEKLEGDRKGQSSIRINDQYRICFVWKNGDAYDVEITDYH